MPIQDYILNNFVMLFELMGLLIILLISASIPSRIKVLMRVSVLLIGLSIIATALEGWTQTFDTLSIWRPLLTAFKYTIYPIVLVNMIILVSHIMKKPLTWKCLFLLSLPVLICIPLFFSSQWSQLVFYYSPNNHFAAGPLRYLPYFLFALYLVIFVVFNIIYLRYCSIRHRIIALYISLVAMGCVVIYLIIGKTEDYNPILTSALVFYFIFIYIRLSSIDPLTGISNRQSFRQDRARMRHKAGFVVSTDMNDLKYINDTYGHAEGDKALKSVANIIRTLSGNRGTTYRMGGDEFIIIYGEVNEESIISDIQAMREALSETPYSCAFGYSKYGSNSTFEDALKEADRKMYADKSLRKENKSLNLNK